MKKLWLLAFLLCGLSAHAQIPQSNVSYNALLNSACATPNAACTNTTTPPVGVTGTTGSALDVSVANYNAATITISGTYAGVTINFDFSDPTIGSSPVYFQSICARTDINLLEASEVVPSNQVRAWQCPVWGATRFRVRISAYGSGSANVWVTLTQAAIDPSLVVATSPTNIAGASDPCLDQSAVKSGVPIAIASATTAQLIALSAGKSIYVCSFSMTLTGNTAGSAITFEQGTGSNCAGSPTALTGAMAAANTASTALALSSGGNGTLFTAGSGQELCTISAGTAPSIQGFLSYVQQ